MERKVFERMDSIEAQHWWFIGRRAIISTMIKPLLKGKVFATILEAGCGTGGNLSMLRDFGKVDAFEFDEAARQVAIGKSGLDIPFGALPNSIPFGDQRYDLIGLFDVLEHVEADDASLSALAARLDENGKILVTVPAFPFMWSKHDERHHHFRRYTRSSLTEVAHKAGLKVSKSYYFNSFLFPVAVASRAIKKLTGSDAPDDQLPPAWLNALLYRIFGVEQHLIGRINMPFGLSLVAVLEKG